MAINPKDLKIEGEACFLVHGFSYFCYQVVSSDYFQPPGLYVPLFRLLEKIISSFLGPHMMMGSSTVPQGMVVRQKARHASGKLSSGLTVSTASLEDRKVIQLSSWHHKNLWGLENITFKQMYQCIVYCRDSEPRCEKTH